MTKRLLAICLFCLLFISIKAQPYGNEWINYSQQYYKIKIGSNGIYRIDSTTLANAGISVNSINAQDFQIFNKGVQQTIYVKGESDGILNASDYIEFYAQKNDGTLDSLLYVNTNFVPNPYYSLVNDTATYYLTWSSSSIKKRMMIETDTSFSSYTPANYFMKEEIVFKPYYYAEGETNAFGGTDPRYIRTEGWFDYWFGVGTSTQYSINTSNRYVSGPNSIIKTTVVGESFDESLIVQGFSDHHLKINYNGNLFADTLFKGYEANRFIKSVSTNSLGNITTDFDFSSITDMNFTSNNTTVSYVYVKYPHTFDLENKNEFTLFLPDNSIGSKSFLNITNFNSSSPVVFYDITNGKRIDVVSSAGNFKILVPNSGNEKKCFIISDANIINISGIQPVTSSSQFTNYATLSTDSAYVIISHKTLMNSAINYKNYRASMAGGANNVILADIDELYDQFAYGIVKSPLSIRNFCNYLLDTYPTRPSNLFLIGKSIHLRDNRLNSFYGNDPNNYENCLVPSFGNPSSDNLLTAGLNGSVYDPAIATGRLSARNSNEVDWYLEKIMEYENPDICRPAEWMKYVLHFGGGSNDREQSWFQTYLKNYKKIIEDTLFGGTVIKEFYKKTSAPIEINQSDTLKDLLNNGVALMTFFGHASGQGFDQSIEDIDVYNPKPGRYPFVLANSCWAGDFHLAQKSSTETFVIANHKGMIGYLGSVGLGVTDALDKYSTEFYKEISYKNYNKSIGSTIQKIIKTLEPQATSDTIVKATCFEMSLHCDPALKLHTSELPDYKITNNDVSFDMTSQIDSFKVMVSETNIGKAIYDSIITELIRTFPNGETQTYYSKNKAPLFKSVVTFKLPIDFTKGIGLNNIKITLDYKDRIVETNENNNTTNPDVDLLITSGEINPVYPAQFAIIPTDTITLKASTSNPFISSKNYKFQIDTTDSFNSPFMQSTVINTIGGVVKWKLYPTIIFTDSTVYYWRVSPDSIDTNGYNWKESSFQYIKNKHGWEQAHFFQFKNDKYTYVKFNRTQRKFSFANDVQTLFCKTGIYPFIPYDEIVYELNNYNKSTWTCIYPPNSGFSIVVFDPYSGKPTTSIYQPNGFGQYGDIRCDQTNYDVFEFYDSDAASRDTMASFINSLAPGTLFLGYSEFYPRFGQYETKLNDAFKSIGANDMNALPDSLPYIIWGAKGKTPGTAKEIIGSSELSILQLDTAFTTNWKDGSISSPIIGPAKSWKSLHWRWKTLDGSNTKDSIVIRVIGIKINGTETTLANFKTDSTDVLNLSHYVDSSLYSTIRLVAYMKDDSLHTPPQMQRWQVIYDPVPEAAINPAIGYNVVNDTLQQGDKVKIYVPIQNISDVSFTDSLLINYWVEDAQNVKHTLPSSLKKKPFVPNEVIIDSINLNTSAYQGKCAFWVEVNPINQPKSQLEQYHFNNIARIPFYATVDKINPLLDVTFDGVHILNNDIVSAKPNILIKLKDENQFLALNDTNDFKVFVISPNGAQKQIHFGSDMIFIPAVLPNNSCKINYTPQYTQDGTFQLIVQAKDKSDNRSGSVDYKINFEIVNKETITEVMNYPNPFSTATHFVFTLTGSEAPTYFKIQIMTITGKVVKEITNDEIGFIHIGRNITDYAWDGKDEFGDQLANGVYLYRLVTSLHGSTIEKRESGADQYFKKGWGKMFLMR